MKTITRLAMAGFLWTATSAWGQAFIDHAEPGAGSAVDTRPTEIRIWFTGNLEPTFSQIELSDRHGKPVTQNRATVDSDDTSLLKLDIPPLAPGAYKVTWRVRSVDTHITVGNFSFTVRKHASPVSGQK